MKKASNPPPPEGVKKPDPPPAPPLTNAERQKRKRDKKKRDGLKEVQGIYAPDDEKLRAEIRKAAAVIVENYLLSHGV